MRHFISAVKIGFIQKELQSNLFCINGLDTTIFIFILSLKGFGWGKGTSPTKKKKWGKKMTTLQESLLFIHGKNLKYLNRQQRE